MEQSQLCETLPSQVSFQVNIRLTSAVPATYQNESAQSFCWPSARNPGESNLHVEMRGSFISFAFTLHVGALFPTNPCLHPY